MKTDGKKIQVVISYAAYVLSGVLIFSPIHKSKNLPLSLLSAVAISFILIMLIMHIFSQSNKAAKKRTVFNSILSVTASLLSLCACLMLLTEIIKDVAYIANRGVSLFYYTLTALSILLVSFRLCTSSDKGIYRFCILSAIPFTILFCIIFLAPFTTKTLITDFSGDGASILSPVLTGIRAGLFYTFDSSVFFFAFKDEIKDEKGAVPKKQIMLGFLLAYTFIIIYNLLTVFIFGSLTSKISDPDYALIKLVRGIDLTEIISAVRIVSFLVKSSLYIYLSAKCLKCAMPKIKLKNQTVITLLYLLIPITFLILAIFDKSLEYGAFQHLIYPVTAAMSLIFTAIYLLFQKKSG